MHNKKSAANTAAKRLSSMHNNKRKVGKYASRRKNKAHLHNNKPIRKEGKEYEQLELVSNEASVQSAAQKNINKEELTNSQLTGARLGFLIDTNILTPQKQLDFLSYVSETGNITLACNIIGVSTTTINNWRHKSTLFDNAVKHALENHLSLMVEEARRRAVDGITQAVYYKGEACGYEQKYSDQLLMFMLKNLSPQFSEKMQVEHSGQIGVNSFAELAFHAAEQKQHDGMIVDATLVDDDD